MKGGTVEDLYDFMSSEIAWRRKELDDIKGLIAANVKFESKHKVLLRSGVAMLYAHWEGFIKKVGKYYINFVGKRRFKYSELSTSFLALSLRQRIATVSADNISSLIELIEFFDKGMDNRMVGLSKEEVNTRSNLNSTVLKNIVYSLGLDYSAFASKSTLIDVKLVEKRNAIAHGQEVQIDENDFTELLDNVLIMMNEFRNQVDNCASQCSYKRGVVTGY